MMIRATILSVAVLVLVGATVLGDFAPEMEAVSADVASDQLCEFDPERALEQPIEELLAEDDPVLGNAESEVIVVEFFDPNCVHCHDFHATWKEVTEDYEDRVRFHKQPFPLWDYSLVQVEAMLIAQRADKYYEMIELQMEKERNDGLSIEELAELSVELGFTEERFAEVLELGRLQNQIQQRRNTLRQAGVRSTPTITINGQTLGSRDEACFRQKIDEALAAADAS